MKKAKRKVAEAEWGGFVTGRGRARNLAKDAKRTRIIYLNRQTGSLESYPVMKYSKRLVS